MCSIQRRNLVTQTVVGQSGKVIPLCIPLGRIAQGADGLPIAAKTDIIESGLLISIALLAERIRLLPVAAESAKGIVVTAVARALLMLGSFLRIFASVFLVNFISFCIG